MSQVKRDKAGIVIGTASGAIAGGAMGGFVVGIPDVVGAIGAGFVGVLLGGYAGAILGGFFGADDPHVAESETEERKAA